MTYFWRTNALDWIRNAVFRTPADIVAHAGYDPVDEWINPGVIVSEPSHDDIFAEIFAEPEKPQTSREKYATAAYFGGRYADRVSHLDRRFNVIWYLHMHQHYPFLNGCPTNSYMARQCVQATVAKNWFIHFCDGWHRAHAISSARREVAVA